MSADARSVILRSTEGAAIPEVWELAGRAAPDDACGLLDPAAGYGLFVDAGARYKTPSDSGVSYFLDPMSFKVCLH